MDESKKLRNSEFWANKKMKCLNCGEELSNANSYRHMCMKNNDIIICSFPNCPVVFCGSDSKEMSEKHLNEVHELKGNLDCDLCKKKFETESKLKRHNYNVHDTKLCGKCNEEVRLGDWIRHGVEKNCTSCNDKFVCSGLFQQHKKSCWPVHCQVCNKKIFRNVYFLEEHMNEQHNIQFSGIEDKNIKYCCMFCYKYLPNMEKFMDHCQEEWHIRNTGKFQGVASSSSRSAGDWSVENVKHM